MKKARKPLNGADRPAAHGRLRIIAGHMRTRIIEFTTDPRTRPMKDRTREAVFNLLGGKLDGYLVADLFAGSGILGFESLSRGAHHAILIEMLSKVAREIRDNAAKLGVASQTTVIASDTFLWADKLPERIAMLRANATMPPNALWCVFICPPYQLWSTDSERLKHLMDAWIDFVPSGSSLVVELDMSTPRDILPKSISWDIRSYHPALMALGDKP